MKKNQLICSVLILFALTSSLFGLDAQQLQNQNVAVLTNRGTGDEGGGSGVLITKKVGEKYLNYVLTCAHIVEDARKEIKVVNPLTKMTEKQVRFDDLSVEKECFKDGQPKITICTNAKVVAYSDDEDLAILKLEGSDFTQESVQFGDTRPNVGDEIAHVGNYMCLTRINSFTRGHVGYKQRFLDGHDYLQTNFTVIPGSSGGGVYNMDGKYIGMVVRTNGETINMAVPIERIAKWAKDAGFELLLDNKPTLDNERVFDGIPIEKDAINAGPVLQNPFGIQLLEMIKR